MIFHCFSIENALWGETENFQRSAKMENSIFINRSLGMPGMFPRLHDIQKRLPHGFTAFGYVAHVPQPARPRRGTRKAQCGGARALARPERSGACLRIDFRIQLPVSCELGADIWRAVSSRGTRLLTPWHPPTRPHASPSARTPPPREAPPFASPRRKEGAVQRVCATPERSGPWLRGDFRT